MNKSKKMIFVLLLCTALLSGCATERKSSVSANVENTDTNSKITFSSNTATSSGTTSSKVTEASSTYINSAAEPESSAPVGKPVIKITDWHLSTGYEGEDVLVIDWEWTNIETEPKYFTLAVRDTVYQHGIECPTAYGCDEVDAQRHLNNIKPGVTYTLNTAYVLQDFSTVEVEVTDITGRMPYLTATMDLNSGEGDQTCWNY